MPTPVICVHCNEHIYDYIPESPKRKRIVAQDFKGVGDIPNPKPGPAYCPKCGRQWANLLKLRRNGVIMGER